MAGQVPYHTEQLFQLVNLPVHKCGSLSLYAISPLCQVVSPWLSIWAHCGTRDNVFCFVTTSGKSKASFSGLREAERLVKCWAVDIHQKHLVSWASWRNKEQSHWTNWLTSAFSKWLTWQLMTLAQLQLTKSIQWVMAHLPLPWTGCRECRYLIRSSLFPCQGMAEPEPRQKNITRR